MTSLFVYEVYDKSIGKTVARFGSKAEAQAVVDRQYGDSLCVRTLNLKG